MYSILNFIASNRMKSFLYNEPLLIILYIVAIIKKMSDIGIFFFKGN